MPEYIKLLASFIHAVNKLEAWRFVFILITLLAALLLWRLPTLPCCSP